MYVHFTHCFDIKEYNFFSSIVPLLSSGSKLTINSAPDVILASWCGKKVRVDKIAGRPGWDVTPAVRNGRIVEIKSPILLQPGPAVLTDGLDAILFALWGAPPPP